MNSCQKVFTCRGDEIKCDFYEAKKDSEKPGYVLSGVCKYGNYVNDELVYCDSKMAKQEVIK